MLGGGGQDWQASRSKGCCPRLFQQAGAAVHPNVRSRNQYIGALVSVTPPDEQAYPSGPPDPPERDSVHPLLALLLAVLLASTAGILVGWETAVTVLIAVLGLFVAYRSSRS